MLLAVNYLHSNGYAHRDIRLQTLYVHTGLATEININLLGFARCHCFQKSKVDGGLTDFFEAEEHEKGNFLFRAPETFIKSGHGMLVDEYAVGVIAYLLIMGQGVLYPRQIPASVESD